MMRPSQWAKNLFVLPALVFSGRLLDARSLFKSLAAFGLFCILSGVVYIFNDLMDEEEDRHHPRKRLRPLPSGRMSRRPAWIAFAVLSLLSLLAAFALGAGFGLISVFYFALNIAYSVHLKRVVILDVLIVSAGYVIRAAAGGLVLHVEVSDWLLLCTTLLALFLVLAKRRHERVLVDERMSAAPEPPDADGAGAFRYRKSLDEYSVRFLDQMINVTTATALMGYILYTVSGDAVRKFGNTRLVFTTPFVIYGIFRYLYLVYLKKEGGNPSESFLNDKPLLINVVFWGLSVILLVYINPNL